VKKVGASGFQRALARLFVKYAPAEWLLRLVDSGGSEIAEAVKSAQVQVSAGLNEMVKQAHIKTLFEKPHTRAAC
jgi:hypothetical protein